MIKKDRIIVHQKIRKIIVQTIILQPISALSGSDKAKLVEFDKS